MFSKAKLKRFNEEVGCAPPPTKYDTKVQDKTTGCYFDKSKRWNVSKGGVPSPTAYNPVFASPMPKSSMRSTSSSRLDTSTTSTSSSASVFLSPPSSGLIRSKSARNFNFYSKSSLTGLKKDNIEVEMKKITEDRDRLKETIIKLEEKISTFSKNNDAIVNSSPLEHSNTASKPVELGLECITDDDHNKSEISDILIDLDIARERICLLEDKNSHLVNKISVFEKSISCNDESLLQKDQLNHLINLRDNLEASLAMKEDLVAELQLQFDQVVTESREYETKIIEWRRKALKSNEELKRTNDEKYEAENKVHSLVAMYEGLMSEHRELTQCHEEELRKKDIEIELLNESMSSLTHRLRDHTDHHISKVSNLETTVSELSLVAKEKEVVETIMQDELKQRDLDMSKLEGALDDVEGRMDEVLRDRDTVIESLEEERTRVEELTERCCDLERDLKEREVLMHFLEKEVTSREAELTESSNTVKQLSQHLEVARQVALDLQQEAEAKLNEVLSLKAEITVKDYDLYARDDTIATLQEEVDVQFNFTKEMDNKLEKEFVKKGDYAEILNAKTSLQNQLTESHNNLKVSQENTAQLEEKVIDLMAEVTDRETDYNDKVRELESELEELSVKYSDSLLEHEATRRALNGASEDLNKEKLLLNATEKELQDTINKLSKLEEIHSNTECQFKEITIKFNDLKSILTGVENERETLIQQLKNEKDNFIVIRSASKIEMEALQSSNTGFMSQITQLRIDIRKKSAAVDDMQGCIETLRDEKLHLTNLRDNLEKTVENKETILCQLRVQLVEIQNTNGAEFRIMEQENGHFEERISDLENHLKEEREDKAALKSQVLDVESERDLLEREKLQLVDNYQCQINEYTEQQSRLNTVLEDLKTTHEQCQDLINNLQTSLDSKDIETKSLKEQLEEMNKTLEMKQEALQCLEGQVNSLKQGATILSQSLNNKDELLTSLNVTIDTKCLEVQGLYKSLEDKQTSLVALEERVEYLEETEDRLASERDSAAVQLSSLRDALNVTKEKLNRLEISQRDETVAEMSRYDGEISQMKEKNCSLSDEVLSWKNKFQQLETMIEPFRDQLDAYEVERTNLVSHNTAAKDEMSKLSEQYAKLLGHNNHKQKIHHVLKLKTENNESKTQIGKLRSEIDRQRRTIRRLEERWEKNSGKSRLNDTKMLGDKENISLLSNNGEPLSSSTPNKNFKKPQRF